MPAPPALNLAVDVPLPKRVPFDSMYAARIGSCNEAFFEAGLEECPRAP